MLAAPFTSGVGIYVFYALQPYLLELYGDPKAYSIAGLAAAIVAGAQIAGGSPRRGSAGLVPPSHQRAVCRHHRRAPSCSRCSGVTQNFWLALVLLAVWGADLRGRDADPARRTSTT